MTDFQLRDLANAVFHLILAGIYVYLVIQARKAPDLSEDRLKLRLSPLSRNASLIGGTTALVIGLGMLGLHAFFLRVMWQANQEFSASLVTRISIDFVSALMVCVAGVAVIGGWRHAVLLYILSIVVLLTTTLYTMVFAPDVVYPFATETIAITCATTLLITGGIAFTLQYFALLKVSERRPQRLRAV
jgi:hypothetical protein